MINSVSSLRVRLVFVVFLAVAPALGLMFYTGRLFFGLLAGAMALAAAWAWGDRLIVRNMKTLIGAARKLESGDLSARTGLGAESGEVGELARRIDNMASALEKKVAELEQAERKLLTQAQQQTIVAALGQFALVSNDLHPLFNHAVIFLAQSLEAEYLEVLQIQPDEDALLLIAGSGWRDEDIGQARVDLQPGSITHHTLESAEPVIVTDLRSDNTYRGPIFFERNGVVSSVTVAISSKTQRYGILGVQTTRVRHFEEDEVHFLQAVANVLASAIERKIAEPELEKLAAFTRYNPNPILELTDDGRITFHNEAAMELAHRLGRQHPDQMLPENLRAILQNCLATGLSKLDMEVQFGNRQLSWSFYPIVHSGLVHCYVKDITDRASLEAQFRQAQKMESVGQLAAGVAHDFNNLLTVIQGHTGMLMTRPSLSEEVMNSLQTVSLAADRAAALTRQLLMFSRKKIMQPQVIDLNDVLGNLTRMLKRVLGESITLKSTYAARTPRIKGDPGMIEQVIMNLSVNARDAMPRGGTLTISAQPVEIDEDYVRRHPESRAGSFACLRVSDTGCGMDPATLSRIFEPFFTTKEAGKGTGLGLATVYGIVRQHEGWVEVTSKLGGGTTFSVYLPATDTLPAAETERSGGGELRGGNETILVVEDEAVLREMARVILMDAGYHVFEAGSGQEAMLVWDRHGARIDLVLTDMVLPGGMTGRDLAMRLLAQRPELRFIFTSGYDAEDILENPPGGALAHILPKPFNHATLTRAVREALDCRPETVVEAGKQQDA